MYRTQTPGHVPLISVVLAVFIKQAAVVLRHSSGSPRNIWCWKLAHTVPAHKYWE